MIGAEHQEEEILGKAYDSRLMLRVLRYLRPYWKLLAVSFVFLMLQTGAQLLGPYITKIAIDRYIAQKDIAGLDLMALAYLGVVLFGFIVVFIQTYTTEYTGQRAMHDLRMEIFSHLQKQDLAYFDRNPIGRLMTRTINDVETLNELFSTGVVGLLGDVSIVFGIAIMMFWLDWELALVCLTAFPVILYISRFYRRRARDVYRESRLILGRLNAGLQENIAGVATIQAFGQEEKMYRRFQDVNLSYRNVLLRSIRYNALFFPVIEVFSALTIGLLLWYGGRQILASTVSAGVVVAFIQYIQRMYQPIRDLAEKYNIMQAAMASSERIFALLDTHRNDQKSATTENRRKSRRRRGVQGRLAFLFAGHSRAQGYFFSRASRRKSRIGGRHRRRQNLDHLGAVPILRHRARRDPGRRRRYSRMG